MIWSSTLNSRSGPVDRPDDDDLLHRHRLEAVLLEAGPCGFEDLFPALFSAFVCEAWHTHTLPQKEGIFHLDCSCSKRSTPAMEEALER